MAKNGEPVCVCNLRVKRAYTWVETKQNGRTDGARVCDDDKAHTSHQRSVWKKMCEKQGEILGCLSRIGSGGSPGLSKAALPSDARDFLMQNTKSGDPHCVHCGPQQSWFMIPA
jgi:hypothetical protein